MKTINLDAPVKCSETILIKAKPEKVWAIVTNVDKWSIWQTDIAYSVLKGRFVPGTLFEWKSGSMKITSTIQDVDPCKRISWTGNVWGIHAIHCWEFIEEEGQTRVIVEESMEGMVAILLKKVLAKQLENVIQNWLRMLKSESEKTGVN